MAETMTYDAGTDSITTEDNLNPAEQEALQAVSYTHLTLPTKA